MSVDRTLDTNKELARRFLEEMWSSADDALIDRILAPEFVFTFPARPFRFEGRDRFRQLVHGNHTAFPDLTYHVVDAVAEGDRVACRWTMSGTQEGPWAGIPASGRKFAISGMSFFRMADGKITECDVQNQLLTMLVQLGVVPNPWP